MTVSSSLSPAAEAVVSAIQDSSYDWSNMDQAHPNVIAAAALRALVFELGTRTKGGAIILSGDTVLAIAAELEGAS